MTVPSFPVLMARVSREGRLMEGRLHDAGAHADCLSTEVCARVPREGVDRRLIGDLSEPGRRERHDLRLLALPPDGDAVFGNLDAHVLHRRDLSLGVRYH